MELFDNGFGVTRQSIQFYKENKERFAEFISVIATDYEQGKCSVTRQTEDGLYCYPVTLIDVNGNKMYLSGVCSGYYGEGPRGLHTVLTDAGFEIDMDYIGGHKAFEFHK